MTREAGAGPPLLELRAVDVARGGRSILADVSFAVNPGERWAVIGPNGAGKSSLLEVVVGARRASRGASLGRGRVLADLAGRARLMAWVADDAVPTPEVRVEALLREAARRGRADEARERSIRARLGLSALLRTRAGELSRGEVRRLALAEALLLARPLVVLDEPFGAFDPLQLREVLALLADEAAAGAAFLVSVHQLSDAEKFADHVLLLHRGRVLAAGDQASLRRRAGLADAPLEAVFLALVLGATPEAEAHAAP